MKTFKKNKENLFLCEECGSAFKTKTVLSIHCIKQHQISPKEYYDKWIREEGEGFCKVCGLEAIFIRSDTGYQEGCCKKHINMIAFEKMKVTMSKNYGIINNFQSESVKETIRQTNIKKFGVDNPNKSKEFRKKKIKTCLEKYGTEYAIQCEKIKETKQKHFEKFGVFYSFQREDVKQKHSN